MGKNIVNKYQGLPLALRALSDLLRAVTHENEWDIVSKSEIWELPEDKIDILQTLKSSYQHLPSHLKQCFGYCSIFPRDHVYKKESVVLLRMAQRLIQPKEVKKMEDAGNDAFDSLLSGSFFHFSHVDPLDDQPRQTQYASKKVHQISILCDTPQPIDFATLSESKTVRSLLFFGGYRHNIKKIPQELFFNLKSLCALDLSHICIAELPNSIGNSKHLRFLDLSWTCIQKLPETIGGLCKLQTLNLIKCLELRTLLNTGSSLINLRHFKISYSTALLRILPFTDRRLLDLPKCIKNNINVRDIDISI
ncbi:hypothetical protein P3X46_007328 [Hevea brasiliensis]|uniref:Disease resistance protein winged helix domain-containing protein n=1 Tax=Hevea brasiliensis TaxID=3981 RepID=A0ABQ9MU72_HEVBR|nr:hypothetical protein P3X46_007328 [Hevea brasiliensis]